MKTIYTQKELVEFFDKFTLSFRASVSSRTPVKMNKKDVATKSNANPYDKVYKIQTINAELNANYEAKVNAARLEENKTDNFVGEERKWGDHVNGVIVKKGENLYLNVLEESKIGNVRYVTEDGENVLYSEIEAFIPPYKPNPKQNLVDDVKVRTFKLDNILEVYIPSIEVRYSSMRERIANS